MENQPNQPQENTNVKSMDQGVLSNLSRSENLKRKFFQVLIGCLVSTAFIAVVAVLTGGFNEVLGRSLLTILLVAVHTIISFGYLNKTDQQHKKSTRNTTELFANTVFSLIAISFITSIFATWQILGGDITYKLYLCYGVVLFATLHADLLYRLRGYQSGTDNLIISNYLLMTIVVFMLFIVIFAGDDGSLSEIFYRFLAAVGIVDATITLTVSIMHRLYLQKHPELAEKADDSRVGGKSFLRNPLVIIVLLYLFLQAISAIVLNFSTR